MRFLFFVFLFNSLIQVNFAETQKDSTLTKDSLTQINPLIVNKQDSATLARTAFVADSLTWYYLRPNPSRSNLFVEKLLRNFITTDPYLITPPKNLKIRSNSYGVGHDLKKTPLWFLVVNLLLLLFLGITRVAFRRETEIIFRAFYDKRMLNEVVKEGNIFSSWQFLSFFLIFSFTTALFIFLLLYKTKASYAATDFNSYVIVSGLILLFLGLKILTLKLTGFLFHIQKLVSAYINIIYLIYLNTLFFLLPLTIIINLVGFQKGYLLIWVLISLTSIIIGFQFVRNTINILLNYRLSKFYLILYLCTLEICPIIIFAKTINTSF